MVTHDRYFLDRVANRILEISHGKLYSYAGDYSRFLELKAQREEMELASDPVNAAVSFGWNWNGRREAAGPEVPSRGQGLTVWKH